MGHCGDLSPNHCDRGRVFVCLHGWFDCAVVAGKYPTVCVETEHQVLFLAESILGMDEDFWIYCLPPRYGRDLPLFWLVSAARGFGGSKEVACPPNRKLRPLVRFPRLPSTNVIHDSYRQDFAPGIDADKAKCLST
jgi:hypothetical protein